jgi:RNA polymerase-associated protein RTF1
LTSCRVLGRWLTLSTQGDDDDFEAPSPRRRRDERSYSEDTEGEEEGEVESYESPAKKGSKKDKGEPAGPADLREVQVTRTKLAEFCAAPWFADWVKGAWVRYLIGKDQKTGEPTYRLCQIVGESSVYRSTCCC